MARTKATTRRKGSGPYLAVAGAPSKTKSKSSKKGKPMHMLQRNQKRRINQGTNVLREIRKAQKTVGFAMTMAPFQRLVREICDYWGVGFRWSRTGLLTLQEAAEDFIIEFFQDTMLVAAHAHRVTIIKKDINTLVRVRYIYDKILNAEDWDDIKMRDILLIPPRRKLPKDEVKVEEITHSYETRGKSAYEELLKQHVIASSSALESKTHIKELKIQKKLLELGPRITIKVDATDPDLEFRLTKDFIMALSDRKTYVTDTLILAALNMFKRKLHTGVMQRIFIADPAISFKLRDNTESSADIAKWFTFCNFEEVDIIFLPYHSNDHWSFITIDLEQKRCYTFNSIQRTHQELGL